MSDVQSIYEEIGQILRDLATPAAEVMYAEGKSFDGHSQSSFFWKDPNGVEGWPKTSLETKQANVRMQNIIRELQKIEPFASHEPFTNYRAKLTLEMKLSIDFEYIPEEQSWARVYMKAVGALSEAEAKELFIPEEHWLVRKKLYDGDITKPEFDAEIERLDAEFEARKAARGGALR